MYTIILSAVGAMALAYYNIWAGNIPVDQHDPAVGVILFVSGLAAAMLGYITASALSDRLPRVRRVVKTYGLAAARSADTIGGSIVGGLFITTGNISGRRVYHVYRRNDDGSLQPRTLNADGSVRIVEDADLVNTGIWNEIVMEVDPKNRFRRFVVDENTGKIDELRVPVGTVTTKFELN